ncbi:MAG: hypothetical protein OEM28_04720 [Nitrosopumilus sp.]|nr:hypothetical protein [Nitrosopumilus sp.]
MNIKQKKYALITITGIFSGIITLFGIYFTFQFISTLTFELSYTPIVVIVFLMVGYHGILFYIKVFLTSLSLWVKNKHILKIITITISFFTVVALLTMLESFDLEISNNDKGILFEIVGFFIYLTPISRYIIKFVTSENESDIYSDIIIKTTAISLVLIGLFLQFSYFY